MKKNIVTIFACRLMAIAAVLFILSCTKDFAKLNTDPNALTTVTPEYIFTKSQYDAVSNTPNLLFGLMQYTTSFNEVSGFGSKYIASGVQVTSSAFSSGYPNEINEVTEAIRALSSPNKVNELAAARIWRVYCFSRLTDLYGGIPYTQAAQGYTAGLIKPAYDTQQSIYTALLNELDAAAQSFNTTNTTTLGTSDIIYGGDPVKWKKFAYSLMLRLGMRMTKVDSGAAQTWVTKAIAGGVILQDSDIAKASYIAGGQNINKNPVSFLWLNNDYGKADGVSNTEGGKYQDVFINYLKQTKDPRMGVIAVVYNSSKVADTSAAVQKGMPATLSSKPADFITYSEPNQSTLLLLNSPRLVFTAAESYFLLSEAALRGWYSGSTASAAYQNGISAAMRQWAVISLGGSAGVITPTQINAYLNQNQLNTAGTQQQQLQQIYTQFWVSIFPDAEEAFASYRRTGYPALVPNNYPGNATGGKIFRRLLYPAAEQNLNTDAYNTAIARQGADDLLTRMWWDKP